MGACTVFETQGPGHASQLARDALNDGFDFIISCGGDGTHNEVLNGFLAEDAPVNPDAIFAIFPLGTASDLARTLCLPKGADAIPFLAKPEVTLADVGKVTYTDDEGNSTSRYFFNAVHLGMGAAVAERVNRSTKIFGGFITFMAGVAVTRLTYKPTPMEIQIDAETISGDFIEVLVARGRYDGGGMLTGPHATLDGGTLEVYTIGKIGMLESFSQLSRLYKGTHDELDAITYYSARTLEVRSSQRVLCSMDGERVGALPAAFEVVTGAVRLVTGPGAPRSRK